MRHSFRLCPGTVLLFFLLTGCDGTGSGIDPDPTAPPDPSPSAEDARPAPDSGTGDEEIPAEDPPAEDSTAEDSTAEDSTAEDSTAEDSTAEDSTAEDSTADDPPGDDPPVSPPAPEPAGPGFSSLYPGDAGISAHRSVIFHSGFESGFGDWTRTIGSGDQLSVAEDAAAANGGTGFMRTAVTRTELLQRGEVDVLARYELATGVPELYWRFHARFVGQTAVPHHWVRVGAGVPSWNRDGRSGTVPGGDEGMYFDLDARDDGTFSFYTYWHEMRSWICNDGSTNPGCEGYRSSSTPYWGNHFHPAGQAAFPRDEWFCVEIRAKLNTVGAADGELAFWINNQLAGEYRQGAPRGRWLRSSFHSHGEYFRDEQGFPGFSFRTVENFGLKAVTLDAYYSRDNLQRQENAGIPVPEEQEIHYDDVVVATERIGCRVPPAAVVAR